MLKSILVLIALSNACTQLPENPRQKQPFVSPNGKYILTVPIEVSRSDGHDYWRVTIFGANHKLLYKDDADFVGNLNVYWYWDSANRVWLQNSDNGRIYYWEARDGQWQRREWERTS